MFIVNVALGKQENFVNFWKKDKVGPDVGYHSINAIA